MASLTANSNASDGTLRNNAVGTDATTWTTLRNAATGASLITNAASGTGVYANSNLSGSSYINRAWFPFDTSSLTSAATVTAATFSIVLVTGGTDTSAGGSVGMVLGSPASPTSLATSDYGSVGSTEFCTRVNFSSLTANDSTYNDFALNASGLAAISKTTYTTLVLRSSFDLDNSQPAGGTAALFQPYFADNTGTTLDPKLVVTYSLPAAWTGGKIVTRTACFRAATR